MRRALLLLTAMALMVVGYAGAALAATFEVDRQDDDATAQACTEATDEDCSLRGAIIKANTTPGADEISVPAGTYTLTIPGDGGRDFDGDVNPTTGDLDIAEDVTINGAGAASTIIRTNTGSDDRVFHNQGTTSTISGVTITGARLGFDEDVDDGGGILNIGGTLRVERSTITDNEAGDGGGISNYFGIVRVERSTISGNTSQRGGGVFSSTFYGPGFPIIDRTIITNSTISGNSANVSGGGVFNFNGLTKIENSTITNNTAPDGKGSGVVTYGDTSTRTEVSSSIISANTNTDVDFYNGDLNTFVSEGYNLIGDGNATSAFNHQSNGQATDQVNVTDPRLAKLAYIGKSQTQTHRPKPGSPAVNVIPIGESHCATGSSTEITTDQRGMRRPQEQACDIGSYENRSPWVKRTAPTQDATGVAPLSEIKAFFSDPMNARTLTQDTFKVYEAGNPSAVVEAQVTYDPVAKKAILDPDAPLERGVRYKVEVSTQVKDKVGNRLDQDQDYSNGLQPKVWSFTVKN